MADSINAKQMLLTVDGKLDWLNGLFADEVSQPARMEWGNIVWLDILLPIYTICAATNGVNAGHYSCVLNFLPSFWQMRRMIVFPELALWKRDPIMVAHTPTK
jgi:hypothetical protein